MNSKTTTNVKKESFQAIKKPHMSTFYTQHIKSQTKVENSDQNLRRSLQTNHQNEAESNDSGYDAVDDEPSLESDGSRSSSQSVKGNTAAHKPSSIYRISDLKHSRTVPSRFKTTHQEDCS